MLVPEMLSPRRRHLAAVLLAALAFAPAVPAGSDDFPDADASPDPPPISREHRYRMSAAIRPLLFWIGDGDVGGARILWRKGDDGRHGYEFLLGSDPARAPRRINRWGFVREEQGPDGATQVGLMRKTDEESVQEAQAEVGFEGEYVFKVIHTEIEGQQARAENTVWLVEEDYTFHDVGHLLRMFRTTPPSPPKVNEASMPPGTHPGFLFAVADLVDRAVAAATREPRELLEKETTRFNFNAVAYELRLRRSKWEKSKKYGDRRYQNLVRVDLESYNPTLDTKERFTLAVGTEGEWKGVPVYVKYQPKWWFKAEGVIDESQVFEHPESVRTGQGAFVAEEARLPARPSESCAPHLEGSPCDPGARRPERARARTRRRGGAPRLLSEMVCGARRPHILLDRSPAGG